MEFTLVRGRPKATKAMKAGTERHAQLEEEVMFKLYRLVLLHTFCLRILRYISLLHTLLGTLSCINFLSNIFLCTSIIQTEGFV